MSKKNREEMATEVIEEKKEENARARVIPDRLNLRRGPNTTADVLYILNKDEVVEVLEKKNEWTQVHYKKQNITGYVMSHLIRME